MAEKQKQSFRWIPVGEGIPVFSKNPRYPENAYSADVLGYIPADKELDHDDMITSVFYDFRMQGWRLVAGGLAVDVTHWMPLPEKPGMEGQNDE